MRSSSASLFHYTNQANGLFGIIEHGFRYSYCFEVFNETVARFINRPAVEMAKLLGSCEEKYGIAIPMISVMGNTVDLHTTVADLMRVGAMSGGLLSGIGSLVSGAVTNAAGLQGVLAALGVRSTATTVTRGGGMSSGLTNTTSQLSYIGNNYF